MNVVVDYESIIYHKIVRSHLYVDIVCKVRVYMLIEQLAAFSETVIHKFRELYANKCVTSLIFTQTTQIYRE